MTKEEIIDNIARLNSQTWKDREEVRTEIGKLLAELNKSLEQQPSEDYVSRQAVLDTLMKYEKPCDDRQDFYLDSTMEFEEEIKALPPVTPTQRWIPVSKRLPNDRNWYLGIFKEADTGWINTLPFVCDYVGKETKATTKEFWILRGFTDIDNPYDYYKNLECVAWQPLPKFDLEWWNAPYKRGNLDGSN